MKRHSCCRLRDCRRGQRVRVRSLDCAHDMRERILNMGIFPGEFINIIDTRDNGPLLINSGETRLALDSKTAESIICAET